MLKDPPLLTIRRSFDRPSAAQLEAIAKATTGWVIDAQNGRGCLGPEIKPVMPESPATSRCTGTAVTCWCGPNDNLAIFAAVAIARPGDVIIVSTEGFAGSGVCGDLLAGMMKNKGIAGLVTDGHVRDLQGLREVGLPVFAAGINPNSCVKSGPGTAGLPVVIGGRMVSSGDLIFADDDGVATIPLPDADDVLARVAEIKSAEGATLERVRGGLVTPPAIEELLKSDRVLYVD
jgi:4-hydroxy-4-methyl-2-oxoglutarate aldolase